MHSTTDPLLRSFVPVHETSQFPIQNLPYGVFRPPTGGFPHVGVAIGDSVLDLTILEVSGLLNVPSLRRPGVFQEGILNSFMSRGKTVWREVRTRVQELLRSDNPELRDNASLLERSLVPQKNVTMLLPAEIGDYTDFYSSREHASNVGAMFRPGNAPLLPNWLHLPVAYHGRASSIVLSGIDFRRPQGQSTIGDSGPPTFGPSNALDFELEMACFIGPGNDLGKPIPVTEAADHIFGLVLLNDWSARDIQRWEYVPLGPFLGKNFCTSISPWIVPLDALEPFRVPGVAHEPEPLPYLRSVGDWAYDIHLEVSLLSEKMPQPERICTSNCKYLYWNFCQQLAHHTINGCNLRPGDLLATGTISGPTPDSYGSLLELSWKGTKPLQFSNGEKRTYLLDGDRITMTGYCLGAGFRIGFGDVTGKVQPAQG